MAGMTPNFVRRFIGLLGWMVLLTSVLAALGAAWILASGLNMLGDMHTATGRVVAHQEVEVVPSHKSALAQHSIVEFVANDGRTLRFTDSMARQHLAAHKIGETVTVRYSAQDPSQAEISSSTTLKIIVGAVMLLFSAIGIAVGWVMLRVRRMQFVTGG